MNRQRRVWRSEGERFGGPAQLTSRICLVSRISDPRSSGGNFHHLRPGILLCAGERPACGRRVVEPSLRGEFAADGMFYLQIRGDPNRTYEVQASADLTTWESVLYAVGPGADHAVEVAEPVSKQSQRFYRMVIVQ